MDYETFIKKKEKIEPPRGLSIDEIQISDKLFYFQQALVRCALVRGRSAIFADTGLGKTAMQLEWARNVSKHGRVLILTPLAVAKQTVREGEKFDIKCSYSREDNGDQIVVTNYEMVEKFDVSKFVGIVLDESSILKSYEGATRNKIISMFAETPFKLACTATPAPNDYTELGNHSEFLCVKSRVDMLSEFFSHDMSDTKAYKLKGHAISKFWKWVSSWASIVRMPSDLGFDDSKFILPKLSTSEIIINVNHQDAWKQGMLFVPDAQDLNGQRAIRRSTIEKRVDEAARLCETGDSCLVWCDLNSEGDLAVKKIKGAIQVKGSDSIDDKEERLLGFASGKYRVMITKASIAGFGLNWQHCNRMIFLGASHSYEQTYQAIRRCWRFGQKRDVQVFVIRADVDSAIIENFRRKQKDAWDMAKIAIKYTKDSVLNCTKSGTKEFNEYEADRDIILPKWI